MIAPELHSTDLTARCLKSVELRLEGKIQPEYTGALVHGQLFHMGAEFMDRTGTRVPGLAIKAACDRLPDEADAEGRPFSDSVRKKWGEIGAEVEKHLQWYAERFAPEPGEELLGVEVPIRWVVDLGDDDEPFVFASHLDRLYRTAGGELRVRDYKWRKDAPTFDYHARNLQFACYWAGVGRGGVMLDADREWDHYREMGEFPVVEWLHVPYLAPYGRKTVCGDVEYQKGDQRPYEKVLVECRYGGDGAYESLIEELRTRVRMFRAGLFPKNPDPTGCHLCESRSWCEGYMR